MRELQQQPTLDLGRLAPGLGDCCGDYLRTYRRAFGDAIRRGDPGVESARRFSRSLDGLLGALYCAADAAARDLKIGGGRVALVAVGGYGRRTVGLHSDVDVLFLCDDPEDGRARVMAEGLLYPLWDAGLQIGHVVRGVEETLTLAREDIRTATTLLDLRHVGGDVEIVRELERGARRQVFEPHLVALLDALQHDTEQRHERYGDSLFLLEPEVKQGRGGLRDLDVAEWAARARWNARSTEDYVRTGALLSREVEELDAARELLWRVRNQLHLRAGRQHDRLTFADQEEIATELGFVDGVVLGVEQFMQAYYRHARVVAQTAERMLDRARPRRPKAFTAARDLGDGTALFDGHVTLLSSDRLNDDPALALRLYRQVVKRQEPPLPFARDAVARCAADEEWRARLRRSEEATQLFLSLLTQVQRAPVRRGSVLDELHEVGLTTAMVPELEPLTGRTTHDVYHVYTVDIHVIRAVDRLRELTSGENAKVFGLASRLAIEAPRRTPNFLAVFLHALGKVHGGDRPERGAQLARPIAERLGLSHVDVEHVAWLVQEQRSLYHWATRRDTTDPATLEELAKLVGSQERLRDLFLVTVSILSTTNPNAMTSWKARMLEELYFGLTATLEGGRASAASRAYALREEVRVGLVGDAGQDVLEAFVDEMPDRYVLANPVDVVRRHARVWRDATARPERSSSPPSLDVGLERTLTVRLGPGPSDDLMELVVVTEDRPGLLADVTAALASHAIAIVDAQIYTLEGHAFDVFLVRRESRGPVRIDTTPAPVDAALVERFQVDLQACLTGAIDAEALVRRGASTPSWMKRRSPAVATEVVVDNEASPRFTVVDVFTRDRSGVLYAIARTLHEQGLTIALSKVNTEGERVADVFYVQDASGGKVRDPERLGVLRAALRERLDSLHEGAS